jgi:hypothetical protein
MTKIAASKLSNMAMVGGNETRYKIVIDNDKVKEWVGIGWIELRDATAADRQKYPIVER